jgi:hypothetical protein
VLRTIGSLRKGSIPSGNGIELTIAKKALGPAQKVSMDSHVAGSYGYAILLFNDGLPEELDDNIQYIQNSM